MYNYTLILFIGAKPIRSKTYHAKVKRKFGVAVLISDQMKSIIGNKEVVYNDNRFYSSRRYNSKFM